MGWLKWNPEVFFSGTSATKTGVVNPKPLGVAEHIEVTDISNDNEQQKTNEFPLQPLELPDQDLPFIPSSRVQASKDSDDVLWIVVDDIVYDCTEFVEQHPGGRTVIESFRGESCSWQFWRFHGRHHMEQDGKPLRIGRTKGVPNRFPERPRFVGLRRLAADED